MHSLRLKSNSGEFETHLNNSLGSEEHRCIEVSEVSDTKNLPLNFPKAVAQCDIDIFKHDLSELIGIVTFRHPYRGRESMNSWEWRSVHFKVTTLNRFPCCFRQLAVVQKPDPVLPP